MKNNPIRFAALATISLSLFWTGCASISVQPRTSRAPVAEKPRRIVVADFGFVDESQKIRVDREGRKLATFKADLRVKMRDDLVKELSRFGIPVVAAPGGKVPPGPEGWLVIGEFTRIDQGSRALRVIVGAGAGGTKMNTRVRVVTTTSGRSICAFRTTGGSNAASGIITSYGPLTAATAGGAAINIIGSSAHGVTEDARRTSKMIADYISQQLVAAGAIPANKAREPKILAGSVDPLGSLRN